MDKMEDYLKQPKIKKEIDWKAVGKEALEWIICILIAYVIYLFLNFFIGSISGVKQVSMFPTAQEKDRVLIQRPTIFKKALKLGDIITFEAPIDKGYYEELDSKNVVAEYEKLNAVDNFMYSFIGIGKVSYIKRVIGVAGDHVVIQEDGSVTVNDQKLDEPYLQEQFTSQSGVYTDVVVPEGCIFVMGDNRQESKDSRYFGCIPLERLDGYVLCRIWPLNKIGKLDK